MLALILTGFFSLNKMMEKFLRRFFHHQPRRFPQFTADSRASPTVNRLCPFSNILNRRCSCLYLLAPQVPVLTRWNLLCEHRGLFCSTGHRRCLLKFPPPPWYLFRQLFQSPMLVFPKKCHRQRHRLLPYFFKIASGKKSSGGSDSGYNCCVKSLREQNEYEMHLSILHLNKATA